MIKQLNAKFAKIIDDCHRAFGEARMLLTSPTFQAKATMRDLIHCLGTAEPEDIERVHYHHPTSAVYVNVKTTGNYHLVIYAEVED